MLRYLLVYLFIFVVTASLPFNFSWANRDGVNYMGINQNQNIPYRCESGWAFATINALNSRLNFRLNQTNFTSPQLSLSIQVLLECDTNNYGCLGVIHHHYVRVSLHLL